MRILIYPNVRSLALSRDNERWQGLSMLLQSPEPLVARCGAEQSGAEQRSVTLRRTHRARLLRAASENACAVRERASVSSILRLASRTVSVSGDVQERRGNASDVRRIGRGWWQAHFLGHGRGSDLIVIYFASTFVDSRSVSPMMDSVVKIMPPKWRNFFVTCKFATWSPRGISPAVR